MLWLSVLKRMISFSVPFANGSVSVAVPRIHFRAELRVEMMSSVSPP